MDIFAFRDGVIRDYREFVEGFLEIRDPRLREHVRRTLDSGALWPDPLLQLNPSFAPGRAVAQLVADGVLHPACDAIFRKDKDKVPGGKPMSLHRHQEQAALRAQTGKPYVLTTGTGSGKSLSYILPIVNHVLREGAGKGVRAVIVYPLNALANSQEAELVGYLRHGFGQGNEPVSFARYTGDLGEDDRRKLHDNPPDIILTNYVMLEYILTRPEDRRLVDAMGSLRFLVLDELHTYRGVFGSHLANVLRRLQRVCRHYGSSPQIICSSATIANPDGLAERLAEQAFSLVSESGAPRGEKFFVFVNPPVVNRELGIRRSYLAEARRVAGEFLRRQLQVIVFAQSRLATEILTTYLKDDFDDLPGMPEKIRGYRGGYLPLRRRDHGRVSGHHCRHLAARRSRGPQGRTVGGSHGGQQRAGRSVRGAASLVLLRCQRRACARQSR